MSEPIRDAFRKQASFCERSGSPFTARLLNALADTLSHETQVGARVLDWPGDPIVDALKLRLAGGLHALARTGTDPELSSLYEQRDGDFHGVLHRVLRAHDLFLLTWLEGPPQTNEVGRAGALWPGLLEIARRFGPKVELLELGASAGLNLNMDRFAYRLGDTASGDSASAVRLAPSWTGPSPPDVPLEIVARAGVDLEPRDTSDPDVANRLIAYVWPDQHDRMARIEAAILLAMQFPPPVERGDGAAWLEDRLGKPQQRGVTRVIYHSIALQYFPTDARERVSTAMMQAGVKATAERPLAWLSMEFAGAFVAGTARAEIGLRCWPGDGLFQRLGRSHPHGADVEWFGETSSTAA